MSGVQLVGAECIDLTSGPWSNVLGMHRAQEGRTLDMEFESAEQIGGMLVPRLVVCEHRVETPDRYSFAALPQGLRIGEHNFYELTVDEQHEVAKLRVAVELGDISAPWGADAVRRVWRSCQVDLGLTTPSPENKANFERIFRDFCTALVGEQQD